MLNEIFLGMYRTAVQSERLTLDFVPEPYRSALADEIAATDEGGDSE